MENIYLIVGLGNPGREYARTRHNAGFLLAERLARRWQATWEDASKFRARVALMKRKGQRLVMCQPQTYMNASGEAVGLVAGFYKVPASRVMVLVDDADLPLGEIRMRSKGSSGGHHGLDSVSEHLISGDYPRLRIGIGRRERNVRQITDYVLGRFSQDEEALLEIILERASDQVECWLDEGIEKAMNRFNGAVVAAP